MVHVAICLLKFRTKSSKHRFLVWFNILSKALRNEVISDEELFLFFKLDDGVDLVKKRRGFEGMIKNYYLLGFEPRKIKIDEDEYLFVLKYNFLFNISFFIRFVLKHFNFRRIRKEVEFKKVKKKYLVNLLLKGCSS